MPALNTCRKNGNIKIVFVQFTMSFKAGIVKEVHINIAVSFFFCCKNDLIESAIMLQQSLFSYEILIGRQEMPFGALLSFNFFSLKGEQSSTELEPIFREGFFSLDLFTQIVCTISVTVWQEVLNKISVLQSP